MDWLPEKKILSLVLHNMEHSCRKEVREDEQISISDRYAEKLL
jgi:hypothetical protein